MAVRLRPLVDGKVTDKEHRTGQRTQSAMPLIDGNGKEVTLKNSIFFYEWGR